MLVREDVDGMKRLLHKTLTGCCNCLCFCYTIYGKEVGYGANACASTIATSE